MKSKNIPDEIWTYKDKGTGVIHLCYIPFQGNDFGRVSEPVKYMRSEIADKRVDIVKKALESMRIGHYECEDGWYSCPMSEEGCFDDRQKSCTCGALERNNKIDEIIHILTGDNK